LRASVTSSVVAFHMVSGLIRRVLVTWWKLDVDSLSLNPQSKLWREISIAGILTGLVRLPQLAGGGNVSR
jgi:hypothetical protein